MIFIFMTGFGAVLQSERSVEELNFTELGSGEGRRNQDYTASVSSLDRSSKNTLSQSLNNCNEGDGGCFGS